MDTRRRDLRRKSFAVVSGWGTGRKGRAAGDDSDLLPSNKSLSIGVRGDTKDVHWMAGVIDEVAVFDTALSLKEIQTIFKSPTGLLGAVLTVGSPQSKLAVTWGQLKG